jgi:pyruvate,water dikinase
MRIEAMSSKYIVNLREARKLEDVGAKAKGLNWLMRQGVQVPDAYAFPYQVQSFFNGNVQEGLDIVWQELETLIDSSRPYAVRSAANLEDGEQVSFAGQFSSFLNNRGLAQLTKAVEKTYASTEAYGARSYMAKTGVEHKHLRMSVIIQEMITPKLAGVAFSKNPITGLDEVIIEAVEGPDASLVQSGATPHRWVHKWGKWITIPEQSMVEATVMDELVEETRRLADLYGEPVDLEWIFDGQSIHWIQVRPITRLGQFNIYSNRIAREVLPGIIKPLVWSVNIPSVNGAWTDLFAELIGPNDIDADSLAKAFYNRAYFNMAVIGEIFTTLGMPEESLELLMGFEGGEEKPRFRPGARTIRYLPRMLRFLVNKLRFARHVEAFLPAIKADYAVFDVEGVSDLEDRQLTAAIDRLNKLYRKIAYFNIVTPLLAMVYDMVFRRQLARRSMQPEDFDLMHGVEELSEYDPNIHLAELHHAYKALDEGIRTEIQDGDFVTVSQLPGLDQFKKSVEDFIAQFGHLSDSGNDLSSVPWRENKDLVLQLIIGFEDQADRSAKARWQDLRPSFPRGLAFGYAFRKARQFRLLREAVSSTYTYGYGLFRVYFLEIGRRLADRSLILTEEDVFYLYQDEALEALANGAAGSITEKVSERRSTIELTRDVILPETVYGDRPPPVETFEAGAEKLSGIPTSRGYYSGPVKVVTSLEEFDRLEKGDVLVIPFSDVAWTPLFAKAGAIVAESGGILSHSSIVAREYDLPAVVSVDGACRIPDGQWVTVDGIAGEVLLHRGR